MSKIIKFTVNDMLRFGLVLGCLLVFAVPSIVAQDHTPNPIFVPLNGGQSTSTPTPIPFATATTEQLDSPSTSIPATPSPELEQIEKTEHHVLRRPIELNADRVHWVDRTYPYGSTQWGTKEVHLGVEFVNSRFTPLFAVEAGTVIFAGTDAEFAVGPYENYYGNVIIIAHDIVSLDGEQIFTLYGHLDRVEVQEGDQVDIGERIGRVGSSGIAIGAHLHFEVRVIDPFDYRFTRNPELWIQYYVDHGMVAGYIHDVDGNPIEEQRLVIRSSTVNREVFTYASDRVNSDPVWQENFTVGDLPAGEYEIVILNDKGLVIYRSFVAVEAYKTTFVDIVINE